MDEAVLRQPSNDVFMQGITPKNVLYLEELSTLSHGKLEATSKKYNARVYQNALYEVNRKANVDLDPFEKIDYPYVISILLGTFGLKFALENKEALNVNHVLLNHMKFLWRPNEPIDLAEFGVFDPSDEVLNTIYPTLKAYLRFFPPYLNPEGHQTFWDRIIPLHRVWNWI